ncbi:MAG: glycosyltransferase family 4 protein [Tannerellaceae bacterium]|nr:glycosyltransferase family 4 protein [Tannerellaceae bacterium]
MNKKANVLIVTPSLDSSENVSGISSMTNLLVKNHTSVNYIPFIQGKKDNEKRGIRWLIKQLYTPFRLMSILRRDPVSYVHFNIGFEPFSLYRDIIVYSILHIRHYPLVLHIHGGRFAQSLPENEILKKIICYFLEKASLIIVLNKAAKKFILEQYEFLTDKRIHVLPNAINSDNQDISAFKKEDNHKLNLLYLGRIDKNKGLSVILEVLSCLKKRNVDFTFHIGGVGPDTDWFVQECSRKIPHNYVYEGLVTGDRKQALLSKSHVFLLPSLFEGLPMALLESMNNWIVPIVTPVGSMPEVIQHGENGFLVKNAEDIVTVLNILSNDRERLYDMGENAKNTIRVHFSMSSYLEKLKVALSGL